MGVIKVYRRHSRSVTGSRRWKALRYQALRRDGFRCQECGARGRLEVDHVLPVRTHPELKWEMGNLRSLCGRCHARKTRTEVFGPENPERAKWRNAVLSLRAERRPAIRHPLNTKAK